MSLKFEIDYYKNKTPVFNYNYIQENHLEEIPQEGANSEYLPYSIKNIQNYHPIYKEFFELNASNTGTIAFNQQYHIVDPENVKDRITEDMIKTPIFTKFAPLLDPIHYMIGKYSSYQDKITVLPQYDSASNTCIPKIDSIYNASYIDNFFYYISSQMLHTHRFIHGIDYYGSFLGIQEKYRIDVMDDIEYLNDSSFYKKNKGVLFEVDHHYDPFSNFGSRGNKNKIHIEEDCPIELDAYDIEIDYNEVENNTPSSIAYVKEIEEVQEVQEVQEVYEKRHSSISTNSSSLNSSMVDTSDEDENSQSSTPTEEDSSEEWSSVDDSEDSDKGSHCSESINQEPVLYAYIKNFPVQLICLEKCEDTFDSLLIHEKLREEEYAAILFQVIMILITYQKCFAFTHNDLHTNNIMFSKTSAEYIDYIYAGNSYRVPTYGRIFKIIDFGRAIYKFKGKSYMSDSFDKGGDAHTQYNCEPFLDEKKKRIEPNPSFDLCRLGCSIYDFVLDENTDLEDINEFQRTILRWCTDDRGKNILYKKNGEDRYPDFKLYKMIARTVHAHIPQAQLAFPLFNQFSIKQQETKNKQDESFLINIDELPVYT